MTDRADKRLVFKRSTTPFLHGRNRALDQRQNPKMMGRVVTDHGYRLLLTPSLAGRSLTGNNLPARLRGLWHRLPEGCRRLTPLWLGLCARCFRGSSVAFFRRQVWRQVNLAGLGIETYQCMLFGEN